MCSPSPRKSNGAWSFEADACRRIFDNQTARHATFRSKSVSRMPRLKGARASMYTSDHPMFCPFLPCSALSGAFTPLVESDGAEPAQQLSQPKNSAVAVVIHTSSGSDSAIRHGSKLFTSLSKQRQRLSDLEQRSEGLQSILTLQQNKAGSSNSLRKRSPSTPSTPLTQRGKALGNLEINQEQFIRT